VLKASLRLLTDVEAVGDVRGIGLLWGVEFVMDKATKRPFDARENFAGKVAQNATERGLLVYPMQGCVDGLCGDHLLIAPPAVITPEQVEWAVENLRGAIEDASRS
jgi:hypothetical protein